MPELQTVECGSKKFREVGRLMGIYYVRPEAHREKIMFPRTGQRVYHSLRLLGEPC